MDCLVSNSSPEDFAAMSPVSTKKCTRCGEGFRGTMAPEEVHCAKCFVKTCEVPEDTDEQFLKLVSEAYGPELAMTNPRNTAAILPMMKDILNQKARLKMLEKDVEESRYKSSKEKNRTKRGIARIREEKKEMDAMMERIKANMMHLALMQPSQSKPNKPSDPPGKKMHSPVSSIETAWGTPLQSPASPRTPTMPKFPTPVSKSSDQVEKENSPKSPIANNASVVLTTPKPSPKKIEDQDDDDEQPSNEPKRSPVKLAAAKFEKAAKKVNTMVTFAKLPTKKLALPNNHPPKQEVNNNDTPVTASSSSEDEGEGRPTTLIRSNSVRDRVKAFEEIQRSASTGSYDRRKAPGAKGIGRRSLTSMKSINV